MGEGKLRERGEREEEEEDRHGQRWETKLLALWDAFLLPSSLLPSLPPFLPQLMAFLLSFHFGQLLVPHYVADAIHFLSLSPFPYALVTWAHSVC